MAKFQDLTGLKFGRLTPLKRVDTSKDKFVLWECKCDCGNIVTVRADDLRKKYGSTKSCGCLRKEQFKKHGKSNTRLYRIWCGIKERCLNKNSERYKDYGGRGITICDEWKNNFIVFYNWAIENNYKNNLTIDRIDNEKGYQPDNCRWITYKDQNQNRYHHIIVEFEGEKLNLAQLSSKLNLTYGKVYWAYQNNKLNKLLEEYAKNI